ncbi:MAG TPA: YajQ family cyclic di-GMP-binding protein [Polyangia bacterium]|nr:YajQ family cyclic di-GMP-binding protein [Polyangia bacterium]
MPSFDVVSKLDMQEVDNAVNQAKKELSTRYDFRGTATELEQTPEGIVLRSSDKEHVSAAYKVLMERFVKRNVSLKALDAQEPEPAAKGSMRQLIKLKQGISTEKGKEIVKLIKDSKLKVQGQIQDEQVRVTGKNRDDLQTAIGLLRANADDIGLDLQYINFRD